MYGTLVSASGTAVAASVQYNTTPLVTPLIMT
jgi:hypothetical protein